MSGLSFVVFTIAASYLPVTLQSAPAIDAPVPDAVSEASIPPKNIADQVMIPLGHPIAIFVDEEVSSKTGKAGDYFPISLSAPIIIDGTQILPAGATGRGQIVHAKKGGFSGSAGELILAARYIEYNGRQISLRSFRFPEADEVAGGTGQDNTALVSAINIAAGPIGFLISGGNIVVAPGTAATAKFKEDTYFSSNTDSLSVAQEDEKVTENTIEQGLK